LSLSKGSSSSSVVEGHRHCSCLSLGKGSSSSVVEHSGGMECAMEWIQKEPELRRLEEALEEHPVHRGLAGASRDQMRKVVRRICEQEVFITRAMLKAVDLALAKHGEDRFLLDMKASIVESKKDLLATLLTTFGKTWGEVVHGVAPLPMCQVYAAVFTSIMATESKGTIALAMLVNLRAWSKMCHLISVAASDVGPLPYLERFAKGLEEKNAAAFEEQVRGVLAGVEPKDAFDYKSCLASIHLLQYAEATFFDGIVPNQASLAKYAMI